MLIRTKENTFTVKFQSGKESKFIKGTSLQEILDHNRPTEMRKIVLAKVNNQIFDLYQKLGEDCSIEWLTVESDESSVSYQQTLCLVFIRALKELFPLRKILIDHSLGKGLYCEMITGGSFNRRIVKRIKKRITEIIENNEPILPVRLSRKQALQYLKEEGEKPTWFLGNREQTHITLYQCGQVTDYLGYPLLPSTNCLKSFDLKYWPPGVILCFPESSNIYQVPAFIPQKKLFQVFQEYGHWESILGIQKVGDINEAIVRRKIFDLIKIAEGLHEKKISNIADILTRKRKNIHVVLIAGPSSSGKTSFTKRLNIQLRVNGLYPLSISLDDYFLDKEETPRDKKGNYDFESMDAIDIPYFNNNLKKLLKGEEIPLPRFDFKLRRKVEGPKKRLEPYNPVLIEGLHGLNDKLTSEIPEKNKLKIYVSSLTQLNITDHLRVPTSDVRLLRRLVRDNKFRNHPAEHTLDYWPIVRRGEEEHIFPFQEEADIIFNSSLIYELSVIRNFAKLLLNSVSQDQPAFSEAQRLLQLLLCFLPIPSQEVPPNSILREFIGNSSFSY